MFPLNGHNVTWPQHRRASMSNSRQLWVNPHQFGLEGSDWIHNNELLVRLRTSLGLPSEGVLKMSPKIPHWGCSLNVFVIVLVFVFVVVFLLVRSCILIALIKCLKGQKSHLVELLVSTALKDLSYIWTIYSTLASTFKPIGSLSSTDENMIKHKLQRFRKVKAIPLKPHLIKNSSCLLTPHTFSLSLSSRLKTGTWTWRRPPIHSSRVDCEDEEMLAFWRKNLNSPSHLRPPRAPPAGFSPPLLLPLPSGSCRAGVPPPSFPMIWYMI